MTHTPTPPKAPGIAFNINPTRKYNPVYAVGVVLLATIATHLYLVLSVFPQKEFLTMVMPSRYGGSEFLWHVEDFLLISSIVMGILAILLAATAFITAKRSIKPGWFIILIVVSTLGPLFIGVMLGNAFANLYSGWVSIFGVLIALAVYTLYFIILGRGVQLVPRQK